MLRSLQANLLYVQVLKQALEAKTYAVKKKGL